MRRILIILSLVFVQMVGLEVISAEIPLITLSLLLIAIVLWRFSINTKLTSKKVSKRRS